MDARRQDAQLLARAAHQTSDTNAFSIWTVRRDGSHLQPLMPGFGARWSPTGDQLVFSAPVACSDGDLFVMNADGTDRRRLLAASNPLRAAAWAPDGRRSSFTRFNQNGGADMFVIDVDGTNSRRLTQPGAINIAGGWSPDGSQIVFTRGPPGHAELLVIDADVSHERSLTDRVRGYDPNWR
jgi:Tol biopolymer transport system component